MKQMLIESEKLENWKDGREREGERSRGRGEKERERESLLLRYEKDFWKDRCPVFLFVIFMILC